MENIYKIYWSEEALNNLKTIIHHLKRNWTEKELKPFAKHLKKRLHLIQKSPTIYPISYLPTIIRMHFIKTNNYLLSDNISGNSFNHVIG
jgi:plasmid stabilization system protein ParE